MSSGKQGNLKKDSDEKGANPIDVFVFDVLLTMKAFPCHRKLFFAAVSRIKALRDTSFF